MKKEITYVFIDAQNLHLSIRNDVYRSNVCISKGWEIDYKKLFILLKEKYKASKILLFIGKIAKYKSLYRRLESYGYILIQKDTPLYMNDKKETYKGNVDTLLVLTAMRLINEYDYGVIISGDGDFLCLIDYWNEIHK